LFFYRKFIGAGCGERTPEELKETLGFCDKPELIRLLKDLTRNLLTKIS